MKSVYQSSQPLMKMAPEFDINQSRPYHMQSYHSQSITFQSDVVEEERTEVKFTKRLKR